MIQLKGEDEDSMSPATAEFIKKLMDPDPKNRLGAQSFEEITTHVFFKDFQWNNIKTMESPMIPKIEDFSKFKLDKDENPFLKSKQLRKKSFEINDEFNKVCIF